MHCLQANYAGSGGGHGGEGGAGFDATTGGVAAGSVLRPTLPGSGSGGATRSQCSTSTTVPGVYGGSAVRLVVGGVANISGVVRMDGNPGTSAYGPVSGCTNGYINSGEGAVSFCFYTMMS